MADTGNQGSIFAEMRERRSRSERLNGLAVERGLEVVPASQSAGIEDDPEIETRPAFDESEIEASVAAKSVSQPSQAGEIADENPPSETQVEPQFAASEESGPADPVNEIQDSESPLGDEPSVAPLEEAARVAEELVDRIGSVVDIQKLPKTQPSRVLSKTAKANEADPSQGKQAAAQTEAFPDLGDIQEAPKASDERQSAKAAEGGDPKKRKKKISLLDSYFKGL